MYRLIVVAAVFGAAISVSLPAFAEPLAACQQRCLTNCGGKGNVCLNKCEGRCAIYGTAKRG
jgi:hypothetical protein